MKNTSRQRIYQAARLMLRDDKGAPNTDALDVFNEQYQTARREKQSVQAAAEIAMLAALGAK